MKQPLECSWQEKCKRVRLAWGFQQLVPIVLCVSQGTMRLFSSQQNDLLKPERDPPRWTHHSQGGIRLGICPHWGLEVVQGWITLNGAKSTGAVSGYWGEGCTPTTLSVFLSVAQAIVWALSVFYVVSERRPTCGHSLSSRGRMAVCFYAAVRCYIKHSFRLHVSP